MIARIAALLALFAAIFAAHTVCPVSARETAHASVSAEHLAAPHVGDILGAHPETGHDDCGGHGCH